MKSNITINVEFLAGSDIRDCVCEAKEKAIEWDVAYVCFNFNGTKFSIGKNADLVKVLADWGDRKRGLPIINS